MGRLMFRYLMTTFLFLIRLPGIWPNFNSGFQPPSQPPPQHATSADPSGLARATLGLDIASWTLLPVAGALVGALIGWIKLQNIKKSTTNAAGKTITQVGFRLSMVNIELFVLGSCISVAVIIYAFHNS